MNTKTFYATFSFELPELINGKPIHEGKDGMVIAIQDDIRAHKLLTQLMMRQGKQISAYGCGPELNEHVHLPVCAGLVRLAVPIGEITGEMQAVNLKEHADWIQEVKLQIEGDVSHGPIYWTQLTMGLGIDYTGIQQQAAIRLDDLSRIVGKIASISEGARRETSLYDEYSRDSLRTLYNSSGFMHKRVFLPQNPTQEQIALHWGLEYLQTYMKSCEMNLSMNFMLRNVHDWEDSFKEQFSACSTKATDYRVVAANIVYTMFENIFKATNDLDTRATLAVFMNHAEHDSEMYKHGPIDTDAQHLTENDKQIPKDISDDFGEP